MKTKKQLIRYVIPGVLLLLVWLTQKIPGWGEVYARSVYPLISRCLSSVSGLLPFSAGDLFIILSITGLLVYPFYGRAVKLSWKRILLRSGGYLVGVYVWFYLAWGLNYSQMNFYQRAGVAYTPYTSENFRTFSNEYVRDINAAYIPITDTDKELIHREIISLYRRISDTLAIHPPHGSPRVKTMMFTPLFSLMGISGYMGPFFCEFNLNGELPPSQYASTYAHELSHLLGITNEAEANFYAYQVCTRSSEQSIRFCGYFSVFGYVIRDARRLLPEEEFRELVAGIRPEIIELAQANQDFWSAKYSEFLGSIQDRIYDLYLKGNKIQSGRKNYSEVIGLLISYENRRMGNTE